jgi:hypothetical protein
MLLNTQTEIVTKKYVLYAIHLCATTKFDYLLGYQGAWAPIVIDGLNNINPLSC